MPAVARFRWAYLLLAYGCIGLGAVGIVVPGLPTTPFLLVAVWAADRGSPRLHRWLWAHPRLGLPLRAWDRERAVPAGAKLTAVVLLVASWLIMAWVGAHPAALAAAAVLFGGLAAFLLSRPAPSADCRGGGAPADPPGREENGC